MVIFHSYVSLPEGIYCPYILSPWYHRDTQLYRPAFLLLFIAEFTSISMLPQNLFMVIPPFITIVIPNYSSIYIYIWIHINIYIYIFIIYSYIYTPIQGFFTQHPPDWSRAPRLGILWEAIDVQRLSDLTSHLEETNGFWWCLIRFNRDNDWIIMVYSWI